MRFAGINIPRDLVAAHAEGEVVFFVGAGASMSPPTNLPSYSELAKRISETLGTDTPSETELREPDVLLGRLDSDEQRDVHRLVEYEIGRATGRNKFHDALAQLSSSPAEVRMVTTNFDDMLSDSLEAANVAHKVYEAPALPLGNDFEGLVHLHGRVGQPARRLVVTDKDFGVAYITRGWAPSFLRDLFSTYVVCFVGYSHEDRMMEYFAKGLPPKARPRYILTDNDDEEHWKRLGVTPVCYPAKKHNIALAALQRWGTWARDTPFGRAQRVRSLGADAPPIDPDDIDFLIEALLDHRLTDEVCTVATSPEWVDWMLSQPPVVNLLGHKIEEVIDARVLNRVSNWLAQVGTTSETHRAVFDSVSKGRGTTAARVLVSAVIEQITVNETDNAIRSNWLRWTLSATNPGDRDHQLRFESLWASDAFLSESDSFLLLDRLISSWSSPSIGLYGSIRDTELLANEWRLRNGCTRRLVSGGVDTIGLLNWLTSFFEQAHRRVRVDSGFDPWNWGRSSIQPHEQDAYGVHDAANVMIDLARDSLVRASGLGRLQATRVRQLWLNSSSPLLRRIALDSIGRDSEMSPADRIELLEEYQLHFDFDLQNEVFALIACVIADGLSPEDTDRLIEKISMGPHLHDSNEDEDENSGDRQIYELLHWALKHSGRSTQGSAKLAEIEARHPEWLPRENPAFKSWMETGSSTIEDEWPLQPEELHERIQANAQNASSYILEVPTRDGETGWWPSGNVLMKVVERWPEDGFAIWAASDSKRLRACVVEGWAGAALDEGQIARVAGTLLDEDLTGLGSSVARLLRPWTNDADTRERWVARSTGRQLARRASSDVIDAGPGVTGTDIYTASINSSIGVLTEFWIAAMAHDARDTKDRQTGLSIEIRESFEELLDGSTHRKLVLAPLLRRLGFFLHIDPRWTSERLLTAIDPSANAWEEVEPLWQVVLHGTVTEDLLDAGLRVWLIECAAHAIPDSEIARELADVAAMVAVQSTMHDADRLSWIKSWIAKANNSLVVDWTQNVARLAEGLERDAGNSLWNRWLRSYVQARVQGAPRNAGIDEVTALAQWTNFVSGGALHEAVKLILQFGLGIAPSWAPWTGGAFDERALREEPAERGRLLLGMLEKTSELAPWTASQLSRVVEGLHEHGASSDLVAAIQTELFRLGASHK